VSDPDGPSEDEIIRASALCDVVEATLEGVRPDAAQMVEDRKRIFSVGPSNSLSRAKAVLVSSAAKPLDHISAWP
jgi:hypothetical protein